jgi:hypothetical protein
MKIIQIHKLLKLLIIFFFFLKQFKMGSSTSKTSTCYIIKHNPPKLSIKQCIYNKTQDIDEDEMIKKCNQLNTKLTHDSIAASCYAVLTSPNNYLNSYKIFK